MPCAEPGRLVASLSCGNKSDVVAMNMFVGIWFKFRPRLTRRTNRLPVLDLSNILARPQAAIRRAQWGFERYPGQARRPVYHWERQLSVTLK
jgi:hypothetical protein